MRLIILDNQLVSYETMRRDYEINFTIKKPHLVVFMLVSWSHCLREMRLETNSSKSNINLLGVSQ